MPLAVVAFGAVASVFLLQMGFVECWGPALLSTFVLSAILDFLMPFSIGVMSVSKTKRLFSSFLTGVGVVEIVKLADFHFPMDP